MKTLFSHEYRVIGLITLAASLLFSIWGVFVDDVINNDGVEYLRAAALFKLGDIEAAIEIYRWPFYPAAIALVSTLSGLHVELAAHLLNASLNTLLCLAFVATVMALGADFRTTIAAAAIIILAKLVNDYRPFIIRDPGYLAFYLLAALYWFRAHTDGRWADAVKAALFAVVATLFSIEGIAFLLLMPLLTVLHQRTGKRGRWLQLSLTLAASTVLVIFCLMWYLSLGGVRVDGVLASDVFAANWDQLLSLVSDKLDVIESELLGEHSSDYAFTVVVGTLFLIIALETVKNVTVWSGFLVLWSIAKRLIFPNTVCVRPWTWLIVINIGVLLAFALVNLFLTGRYTQALSLTLLLAAPFGLLDLYERWRRPVSVGGWFIKVAYPVMVIFIVISGIEGLGVGTEKSHIKEAGRWIGESTRSDTRLLTNNKILGYYTAKQSDVVDVADSWRHVVIAAAEQRLDEYDTVAIRIGKRDAHRADRLIALTGREPDRVFENGKADRVLVYQKP